MTLIWEHSAQGFFCSAQTQWLGWNSGSNLPSQKKIKREKNLELKIYFIRLFSSSWASVESWSISKCGKRVLNSWLMKQRKIPDLKAVNCCTNLEKKIQMWAEWNGFISSFCAALISGFLPCWAVFCRGGCAWRHHQEGEMVTASPPWSKEGLHPFRSHHRDSQISTATESLLPLTVWVFTSD